MLKKYFLDEWNMMWMIFIYIQFTRQNRINAGFTFQFSDDQPWWSHMCDEATRLCHSRVFPTRIKLFKHLQHELPEKKEEEKILP